jgi:hypothetical protein
MRFIEEATVELTSCVVFSIKGRQFVACASVSGRSDWLSKIGGN